MKALTKEWLEFTKRDLAAAEELLQNEYLANVVLLHCQQAVEKVFKAVLQEYDIAIPHIHKIIKLYALIPQHLKTIIAVTDEELKLIEVIYNEERYPGEMGLLPQGFPTKQDAEEIFEIASEIVNRTIKFLENINH